ncbi:cell surface A33 antigen-like [Solea senegalensis]|uniref:Cell surface A33 antigen-like n=2 Tax=Solea senegalensis TaxID=28829 RepID=A0AAV6Q597_SOLSE|nr:cell surface A33 antigen-like [Solea senegalensis]KAG7483314.1 cell surface A33 antigen-like [Solea senegalensis]
MQVFAMEGRIFGLLLLCLVMASVGALKVVIPLETYEFARGDNITLPCTFTTTKPADSLKIITWSAEAEKANAKETVILTYYSDPGTTDIKSMYEGRALLDLNLASGKANLKLSSITLADNKVFECRVMIPGDDEGTPADTARLVVLVAPSKPICEIQGKAEYGQNINLTCRSEEGSPPPTYKWESRDVRNAPRLADPRTTDKGGILSLYNISKETSGYYTCTSKNKIRSASCNITLSVMPPSINVGSTTIIIVVVIAVLLLLAIITFFCCRHHKKKKEREAYAMGVRKEEYEDKEEPPRNGESRRADGQEDNRDNYEERSERGGNDDRRRDYDDRRSDYDDRRSDYDDRRSDYDNRRKDYDDRRSDYSDRRDRYPDQDERSNDNRRYDDARRYDDRYDEPYDDRNSDRPPVPNNKPPRRDYDD